jgi:ubiquinone/menaquinone biosynthesis C-methylase UbiE
MDHNDHVFLLREGIPGPGGVWADLGSGTGAFTLALADTLGPQGEIYSIDKDRGSLSTQSRLFRERFPKYNILWKTADFTHPLDLPPLDGIVIANALHFQRAKEPVLQNIRNLLRLGGRLILVEYNVDHGNFWVPYPLSYTTWEILSQRAGFKETRLLATVPSHFLKEFYSALSFK